MTIAQIQRDAEFGQALAALSADGRINTLAASVPAAGELLIHSVFSPRLEGVEDGA